MSRLDGRYADVQTDALGRPTHFIASGTHQEVTVHGWASHHREWIGVLDGEAQRDVWLVSTNRGVCELHCLSRPKFNDDECNNDDEGDCEWVLFRRED